MRLQTVPIVMESGLIDSKVYLMKLFNSHTMKLLRVDVKVEGSCGNHWVFGLLGNTRG